MPILYGLMDFDIKIWGYVLCFIGYLLTTAVTLRSRMEALRRLLVVAGCLATAAWALAGLLDAGESVRVGFELTRTACWLVFFIVCLGNRDFLSRWIGGQIRVATMTALLLIAFPIAGLAIQLTGHASGIMPGFIEITMSIFTLVILENILRNSKNDLEPRVVLFCITLGAIAVYDILCQVDLIVFNRTDVWFVSARGLVFAIGAPFLAIANLSGKGWQGEFALSRRAIFHSTVLVGTGIYLITTSVAGELLRLNSGHWGLAAELTFFAAAVISLTVLLRSASVRARAMVLIGKHFFRLKYDYREVWLNFIRRMAGPDARENLHERTLRAIADAVQCESGALWVLQEPIDTYVGFAHWNLNGDLPMIPADGQLPTFLSQMGWIIDIDQCANDPAFYSGLILPNWFERQSKLWILVPLIHNRVLEAFAVLGNPRTRPSQLGWEEFDLLKTVGAQAAGYLAEERASRELLDTRQLAEFNRRFAFVVHDIKNVVNQMSLMLQNSERYGADPLFQQDMLETVDSSVERLRGMLVQLGTKQSFRRPETHPLEVTGLVSAVVERLKTSYGQLSYRGEEPPIVVKALADKLASALEHLIQNAVEAVGQFGTVEVCVTAGPSEAVIEVRDDGPGMSSEFVRTRLFRPLETSKPNGSGLGAYQSLRMVTEMGGRLDVDSKLGNGTTMRIRFPLHRVSVAANEEALHDSRFVGQS